MNISRNGIIFYTNSSVQRISLLVLLYMRVYHRLTYIYTYTELKPTSSPLPSPLLRLLPTMATDVKIPLSPYPPFIPRGRGGVYSVTKRIGPADHPATVISALAPFVPPPLMTPNAETNTTLPSKDADGDLLAGRQPSRLSCNLYDQAVGQAGHPTPFFLLYAHDVHSGRCSNANTQCPLKIINVHGESNGGGGDSSCLPASAANGNMISAYRYCCACGDMW